MQSHLFAASWMYILFLLTMDSKVRAASNVLCQLLMNLYPAIATQLQSRETSTAPHRNRRPWQPL